jgi:ABC-type transport system involved in multi-copper enzyme maturation permease subunit
MSMGTANPYSPINPINEDSAGKKPLKGFTPVVCVFFIILGSLGLLQALGAAVQLLVASAMAANAQDQAMLNVGIPGALAISIAFAVVNAGVSVTEIIAGVLGMRQKRTGATLIRAISGFMLLFKVLETVFGVVQGYLAFDEVKAKMMKDMAANQNGPQVDMEQFLNIGLYFGLAIVVVMGLVMFIFYLASFLHFSKQSTLDQFS